MLEGRDAAMSELRGALALAAEGRGRLAVVSGDAGIGKSSVASAIAADAEQAGAEVHWGRAWEFADAPPYFPLRGMMRSLGIDPHDGGAPFQLWESVVEALAATKKPVVWLLEDLHAADILTLDLLTFLAQAVRGLRVLVVVTTRAKDPRLDERASQRLTRMARDGIDLRLSPLGTSEVGAVAARVCGGPLPRAAIDKLAELTGGNPLFVVECARAFKESGTVGALPPTVRDVVLERFEHLAEATRAALAYGAILGREFTAGRVAKMQDALPARVIDTLLPALRSGLVTEIEPGRFFFSHVIVRDVVEETLSAEARARAHAAAEAALSGDEVEVVVERARHALIAASLDDAARTRALEHARRAIALLDAEGGHDRAYALCERMVAAIPDLDVDDLMQIARIARAAGRNAECVRTCERIQAKTRATGDAVTFAKATLLSGAIIRPGFVDHALVANLEEGMRLLGDREPALRFRMEARRAGALQPNADPQMPVQLARDAIAKARALGDDAALLDVLDMGASALVDFAPVEERIAVFEEILTRATASGELLRVLRAHVRLAIDHAFVGNFAAFDRDVDSALAVASRIGHPRHRWGPLLLTSMRALARGDFAESERTLVEVAELATLTDNPALALSLGAHRMMRAATMHDDDGCRAAAEMMPRLVVGFPHGPAICAMYRLLLFGRLEDASAVRAELAGAEAAMRHSREEPMLVCAMAEALAIGGSEEVRRELRANLAPLAGCHAVGGHVMMSYDGPVARALAILDASLGDFAAAIAGLERSRESVEAVGYRPWVARVDYDLARVLERAGRSADARARAARCEALATELGMEDLSARARSIASTAPATVAAAPVARMSFSLVREGDTWRLDHGKRSVRVKDSRGMQLLARLVERTDEEVHVLALASDEGGGGLVESHAGEAIDDKARRAYRDRLKDLGEELAEAERNADRGRVERLRDEMSVLQDELARAVGLGGRSRKDGSATERARVNVQRRLKDAIARVSEVDGAIGKFLERAVRTGTFCCYRP